LVAYLQNTILLYAFDIPTNTKTQTRTWQPVEKAYAVTCATTHHGGPVLEFFELSGGRVKQLAQTDEYIEYEIELKCRAIYFAYPRDPDSTPMEFCGKVRVLRSEEHLRSIAWCIRRIEKAIETRLAEGTITKQQAQRLFSLLPKVPN
jgi:hypothetical protein